MSVRLMTNLGSNLPAELVKRMRIVIPAQKFEVNGTLHDFGATTTAMVDGWLASGAVPQIAGTTASEFVARFREVTNAGDELLVITSSRRLTTTHDNAVKAAAMLKSENPKARVAIVDSGASDITTGLIIMMAGRAAEQGRPLDEIVQMVNVHATEAVLACVPGSVDYLVKSGRASSFKGFMANLLKVAPIVTVRDGAIIADGTVPRGPKAIKAIVDYVASRVGTTRPVWAGIAWSNDSGPAAELEAEMRNRFDVRYMYKNALSITAYLHLGTRTFAIAVIPVSPDVAALRGPELLAAG